MTTPTVVRVLKELQDEQIERLEVTRRNSNLRAEEKHAKIELHTERVLALGFILSALERSHANKEKV